MSTIKSSTTTTTAYSVEADTTGTLVLQTGATPTTAVTVGTDQSVTLAGTLALQSQNMSPYTGFKNRLINSAMVIDQRNAGASVSTASGAAAFTLDRFKIDYSQTSKFTLQQNAGSVTPPAGFGNYLGVTSSSAYSVLAGDYFQISQAIEGFNTSDLAFGTASAATVTLSFWVRSSLTGTFGGALQNSAVNRSYPYSYTISVANTWEQKTITIAGDTSGTWIGATNGIGLAVSFNLGMGSTRSGTANAWASANYLAPTGATSVVGTNGATFYITGVQLEKGSTATSFDYRPYSAELALCQRYFYKHQNTNGGASYPIMLQVYSTTAAFGKICDLPVTMRTFPTTSTTATSGTFTPSLANGTAAGAFTGTNIETSTTNALCTGAWTGSSGLVAGNVTVVSMPNNAFFSASAEL
jgi:hypothetical protein